MPFNRIEELAKVREKRDSVYKELYKSVRRMAWELKYKSDDIYDYLERYNIRQRYRPEQETLSQKLKELRDREYRLMTQADLKQRYKGYRLMSLVVTYTFKTYQGLEPFKLKSIKEGRVSSCARSFEPVDDFQLKGKD